MPFIIAIVIVLVIVGVISAGRSFNEETPEDKGKAGEEYVSKIIEERKTYGEHLIDDVIIPGRKGTMSSQIDHILVSSRGIFVIETKSHSGRMYGSDSQERWTQVLAYGAEKHELYSPIKQNEVHINRLKGVIKGHDVPIYNIVVFIRADISNVSSRNVFNPIGFKRFVSGMPQFVILQNEVDEIANKIMYYKEHPTETDEEHAAKVQEAKRYYEEGRCPRCGGELVLRHSREGRSFYGCSNYPKCKYTRSNKKPQD